MASPIKVEATAGEINFAKSANGRSTHALELWSEEDLGLPMDGSNIEGYFIPGPVGSGGTLVFQIVGGGVGTQGSGYVATAPGSVTRNNNTPPLVNPNPGATLGPGPHPDIPPAVKDSTTPNRTDVPNSTLGTAVSPVTGVNTDKSTGMTADAEANVPNSQKKFPVH